jgi:hypothetical protein
MDHKIDYIQSQEVNCYKFKYTLKEENHINNHFIIKFYKTTTILSLDQNDIKAESKVNYLLIYSQNTVY